MTRLIAQRPAQDLAGQVCLVTGGAQGIGWQLTLALAQQGAQVHLCDVSAQNLERVERHLSADTRLGAAVTTTQLDVTDRAGVENWVRKTHALTGRIDVLINNAAFVRWVDVEDMTVEEAERSMRTCYDATVYGVKAALPLMQAAGRGRIVNIGSSAGLILVKGPSAAYAAAKAAVEAYTQILRMELEDSPVHVTLVRPGAVAGTDFFGKHVPSSRMPRIADFLPPTSPERVAAAVVNAIRNDRAFVDVPRHLPLMYRCYALAPLLFQRMTTVGGSGRRDYAPVQEQKHERKHVT